MNRYQWRRREILQAFGMGCLPLLLDRPARAATVGRLICVVQVGGYLQASWRPPQGPLAAPLPDSCVPLTPFLDHLTFLPDLTVPGLQHESSYQTMFHGAEDRSSVTVDQVIAAATGTASLPLGVQVPQNKPRTPDGSHAFFGENGLLVEPINDPYRVYRTLFAGAAAATIPPERLLRERKSVLDLVTRQLGSFRAMAGKDDRFHIDLHLASIRSLEQQVATGSGACAGSLGTEVDVNARASHAALFAQQLQLAVMALACGQTRVVTVQVCDAEGGTVYPLGDVAGSWSAIAADGSAAGLEKKRRLDGLCMQRLADLLGGLQARPDGTGTLLDSTTVLWANTVDDGRTRDPRKLPWLLAGGPSQGGQCAGSAGQPTRAVLASVCNALAVPAHPFGSPLAGL